ncbi:hypothetical protein CRE_20834 [Caenorhabditis remanei]|uniref:Uncharacterized protein n=1 Tax=Caenorhabditis remanei TaxID=31234 RepID=E3MV22_CAERE|nr:hypothetical protein CRE_20834 [Caenorhabditis remanei]
MQNLKEPSQHWNPTTELFATGRENKKLQSDYDKAKEAYEYYQGKCGTMKVHLDYLREKLVFAQEESVRFRTLLNEVVEKVTGFATKVSVADTEL